MKNNELKIIFKAYPLPKEEYEKRVDEISETLYELYCQYRLKESIHQRENNNNLTKENVQ